LWRAHSDTLGFFPEGAFAQHAQRGWVLAAKTASGQVVGYLLYRISRGRAVIVHLCTDDANRGQGIAHQLFRAFRDRTADLLGARLTCRTDFAASRLWSRLGFVRVWERTAREEGKTLGIWEMDYGHPDLFSATAAGSTVAVMDANVFFDLAAPVADTRRTAEARALRADWLQSSFTLAVTPELSSEISRNKDRAEQKRLHRLASGFLTVKARPHDVDATFVAVEEILGRARSASDHSDRRQLAYAIASQADLFLTCDGKIIDHAERLQATFGIRVLQPVDLINDIDAGDQPWAYAPARLEGSSLSTRQVRTEDLEDLKRTFLYFEQAETVAGLPATLRSILAHPRTCSVRMVTDRSGAALAVIGLDRVDTTRHRIRALRVRRDGIAPTLARHLVWRATTDAVRLGADLVTFEDRLVSERIRDALSAVGFIPDGPRWVKLILRGCLPLDLAHERLTALASTGEISAGVRDALVSALEGLTEAAASDVARMEHLLWPLKLRTAALPCYIVPIRPVYAAALFDTAMASESLFDADSELLLRLENVYYRAPQPMLRAPARVLWYVSGKGRGYSRSMHLSAASTVTEVVVGEPKLVFSRFRRFGAYSYQSVKEIAERDRRGRVMAFTFSQTEVFESAIPLDRVREALRRYTGRVHPLVSPAGVPPDAWFDLYMMGGPERA
jgi:GNAT superfamily N-acetyltransferase/predicted nucleic acid-binding protein